uniref:Uncharacterized protein n=1 Tax=Nelumbo nucifera TaxID=4432 RepID=A0A822Y766_NELNU|nr:TPA_asm: hypothetical protein HUJ06_026922 [Nelumbo nucifera]
MAMEELSLRPMISCSLRTQKVELEVEKGAREKRYVLTAGKKIVDWQPIVDDIPKKFRLLLDTMVVLFSDNRAVLDAACRG